MSQTYKDSTKLKKIIFMKELVMWGWDEKMFYKLTWSYHLYVNICVLKIIYRKLIIYKETRKKAEIHLKVGWIEFENNWTFQLKTFFSCFFFPFFLLVALSMPFGLKWNPYLNLNSTSQSDSGIWFALLLCLLCMLGKTWIWCSRRVYKHL